MGYCTSCTSCCQMCGDPDLEDCPDCRGEAPDTFWAIVGMMIVGMAMADLYARRTDART